MLGVDFETFLRQHRPYLTSEEIQTLRTQGFEIGAHSIDHPHYADLTLAEQVRQTEHCATDLKARFGLKASLLLFHLRLTTSINRSSMTCSGETLSI